MELFISLFIGAAIILILIGFFGAGRQRESLIKLREETHEIKKVNLHSYLTLIFPFSQRLLKRFKLDVKINNRLHAAHIKLGAQEFFNLKLLVMLSLGALIFFSLGKWSPWIALGLLLGYIIPDIYLNRKIKRRKYNIVRVLPETVDLLGLCVEAGLDFTTAVKWIIEKTPSNPMVEELAFVLEEIKWGKSRSDVLRDMAKKLSIPEVSSFVQTLVQAERMGTPVAEAFTMLSEDTRLQRYHRGERVAMRAPIKILIPLIFCILPVIAIVIGGPILLQFLQGELFSLGG